MDNGLFSKYNTLLNKRELALQEIIIYIQETTGITLSHEELFLSKKIITIQTTSVKKSILLQKNIKDLLKKKGYIVKD